MTLAIFGTAAVLFAILLIFQKTLYGSAMCLLAVLLQIAAIFFILGAQLLGFIQVLVYAGAIMVLIVVAIMAGGPKLEKLWAARQAPPLLAIFVLLFLGVELTALLFLGGPSPSGSVPALAPQLEQEMAVLLFGRYAIITEIAGLMFLVAALAVVDRPSAERGR